MKKLTRSSVGYLPNFCFISLCNNVSHFAAYLVLPSLDSQNNYQCDSYWDSNGHHSWVLSHTQHHRAGADLIHMWQVVTSSHNHSSCNFVKRKGNQISTTITHVKQVQWYTQNMCAKLICSHQNGPLVASSMFVNRAKQVICRFHTHNF
jgi:hypothetical protein